MSYGRGQQRPGFGGGFLSYVFARILADQPVEEKVTFNRDTQVDVPQAQTWHAGVAVFILSTLFVAAWFLLPPGWALGLAVGACGFLFIIVATWGARDHHDGEAFDTIRQFDMSPLELFALLLFTKQFWALLAPIGLGMVTYVMAGLSRDWWDTYYLYMFGIAAATGPMAMAFLRVYLYSRETVVRYEMTPWQRQLLRVLMPFMPTLIAKEAGLSSEESKSLLDRMQAELSDHLDEVEQKTSRPLLLEQSYHDAKKMAKQRYRLDLLQFIFIGLTHGFSRRDMTVYWDERYGETLVLPITGLEITDTEYRKLVGALKRARVLVQEHGHKVRLGEFDPATLLMKIEQMSLPMERRPDKERTVLDG